jgi:hypothetical protein
MFLLGKPSTAKNQKIPATGVRLWNLDGELLQMNQKLWQVTGGMGKHVSQGAWARGRAGLLGT